MNATQSERLQRGDFSPEFMTQMIDGTPLDSKQLMTGPVWISFYRYASCPLCNMHFDDVLTRQKLLADNGITFVAVFESKQKYFPKRLLSQRFPQVSIVSDPDHQLYLKYGVERSFLAMYKPDALASRVKAVAKGYGVGRGDGPQDRVPANFLILPGGYIHQAYYGKSISDHIKWRDLEDFIATLEGVRKQTVNAPATNTHGEELDPTEILTSKND